MTKVKSQQQLVYKIENGNACQYHEQVRVASKVMFGF
jgi:hypothetical protein